MAKASDSPEARAASPAAEAPVRRVILVGGLTPVISFLHADGDADRKMLGTNTKAECPICNETFG
jgi:hypothetical protein